MANVVLPANIKHIKKELGTPYLLQGISAITQSREQG
ncbi:hypothetical protein ARTHRO8AJ_90022 [Arthrobacter sp. 8AJ]|nr:hypothetical protein ARTHRO8AJ_90022 [Arthrobacter sp. 8AJ]